LFFKISVSTSKKTNYLDLKQSYTIGDTSVVENTKNIYVDLKLIACPKKQEEVLAWYHKSEINIILKFFLRIWAHILYWFSDCKNYDEFIKFKQYVSLYKTIDRIAMIIDTPKPQKELIKLEEEALSYAKEVLEK